MMMVIMMMLWGMEPGLTGFLRFNYDEMMIVMNDDAWMESLEDVCLSYVQSRRGS